MRPDRQQPRQVQEGQETWSSLLRLDSKVKPFSRRPPQHYISNMVHIARAVWNVGDGGFHV
jgi:hypothetical protein